MAYEHESLDLAIENIYRKFGTGKSEAPLIAAMGYFKKYRNSLSGIDDYALSEAIVNFYDGHTLFKTSRLDKFLRAIDELGISHRAAIQLAKRQENIEPVKELYKRVAKFDEAQGLSDYVIAKAATEFNSFEESKSALNKTKEIREEILAISDEAAYAIATSKIGVGLYPTIPEKIEAFKTYINNLPPNTADAQIPYIINKSGLPPDKIVSIFKDVKEYSSGLTNMRQIIIGDGAAMRYISERLKDDNFERRLGGDLDMFYGLKQYILAPTRRK